MDDRRIGVRFEASEEILSSHKLYSGANLVHSEASFHRGKAVTTWRYPLTSTCYACNRPRRPIGLWEVEAPTFSRYSAQRWRWGQLYAPAALLPLGRFLVLISVRGWVDPRGRMRLEGLEQLKINSPRRESNPQPSGLEHHAISEPIV
jgi:hypothetical protein